MFYTLLCALLAVSSIALSLFCLYLYFQRRQRMDLVYDNSAFFMALFLSLTMGAILLYLVAAAGVDIALIPAVIAFICLLYLLAWHNEIIVFDETGFTRRNAFLRSRRYRYDDITACSLRLLRKNLKRQDAQSSFRVGNDSFIVPRSAVNYEKFAALIRKHGRSGLEL